jgi:xanthine dehydrogenase accessory factor
MDIGPQTYLVLVTRGVEVDVEGLPALLATDAPYIGLIGSKKRWTHCQMKLKEAGVDEAQIGRITSPIGLDIHAETPDEIAVSIMAEIIALRNKDTRAPRKV